jgi:hypothetical protein
MRHAIALVRPIRAGRKWLRYIGDFGTRLVENQINIMSASSEWMAKKTGYGTAG